MWFILAVLIPFGAASHDNDAATTAWMQTLYDGRSGGRCCGETDAYVVSKLEVIDGQSIATIDDDREVPGRTPIPKGTKVVVPPEKLGSTLPRGNPTENMWIFLHARTMMVYCFVMGSGS